MSKKTGPPKSAKCSNSKMLRARKLKRSQPVYLVRKEVVNVFSFLALRILELEHFEDLYGLTNLDHMFCFEGK